MSAMFKRNPGFTPTSISGCQLWLDGSDSSSMTFSSGSNISVWKDKSASSNNFSLTSGTTTNINDGGYSVVNFPSGAIMTSANQITFTTSSAFFLVSKVTDTTYFAYVLGFSDIYSGDLGIKYLYGVLTGTPASSQSSGAGELGSTTYYVNGSFNPSFGSNYYTNVYAVIDTVSPVSGGTSRLTLSSSFNSRYFTGKIAEFLFYPGGVTSTQREQVEAYLAQKWGLVSQMADAHMAKRGVIYPSVRKTTTKPYYTQFSPNSIAGCVLWLDAADQSSMSLSGSTITAWNDKSRNSQSFTVTGTPTLVINSQNGNSSVSFNGSSYFQNSTLITPIASHSAFVVFKFTTSGYYGLVGFSTSAVNGYDNANAFRYAGNAISSGGTLTNDMIDVYANNGGYFLPLSVATSNALIFYEQTTVNSPYPIGAEYYNGSLGAYTSVQQFNYTPGTSATGIRVGGSTGNTNMIGNIYEVIVYNQTLTGTQRQTIESYLAQKWGLTTTLPSTHTNFTLPAGVPTGVSNILAKIPTSIKAKQIYGYHSTYNPTPSVVSVRSFNGGGNFLYGIDVDKTNTYAYTVSRNGNAVYRITLANTSSVVRVGGGGGGGYAGPDGANGVGGLYRATGLVIGQDGNIYIAEFASGRVRKLDLTTNVLSSVAGNPYGNEYQCNTNDGTGAGAGMCYPNDITYDSNNVLYFTESTRVRSCTLDGVVTSIAGGTTSGYVNDVGTAARFSGPYRIACDRVNNFLYIADNGNQVIRKYVIATGVVTTFATSTGTNSLLHCDEKGTLFVANQSDGIRAYQPDGSYMTFPNTSSYTMTGNYVDMVVSYDKKFIYIVRNDNVTVYELTLSTVVA